MGQAGLGRARWSPRAEAACLVSLGQFWGLSAGGTMGLVGGCCRPMGWVLWDTIWERLYPLSWLGRFAFWLRCFHTTRGCLAGILMALSVVPQACPSGLSPQHFPSTAEISSAAGNLLIGAHPGTESQYWDAAGPWEVTQVEKSYPAAVRTPSPCGVPAGS